MTDDELLAEQRRIRNLLQMRIRRAERDYGVTPKTWETAFNMQGRKCACCGSLDPKSSKGWHIDHSHENGLVRGILCSHCNVAIAMVGDDPERAMKLAKYIKRTKRWHQRCEENEELYGYAKPAA